MFGEMEDGLARQAISTAPVTDRSARIEQVLASMDDEFLQPWKSQSKQKIPISRVYQGHYLKIVRAALLASWPLSVIPHL